MVYQTKQKNPIYHTGFRTYERDSVTRFFASSFSWIIFPKKFRKNNFRVISKFFENLQSYSQVKVHHRYRRHRRWQILNWCKRHQRKVLPLVTLVLLIPVANLLPVSLIPVVHLDLRISPRIAKNLKWPWKWFMQKTWSRKACGTVSLSIKRVSCILQGRQNCKTKKQQRQF